MAKLESAKEFIALVESGKYETKVNAQRGAGRTRLSEAEKAKAFAFIDKYFPDDGESTTQAKPGKKAGKKFTRMAKKAKKVGKKVRAAVPAEDFEDLEEVETEEAEEVEGAEVEAPEADETPKPGRKAKKKAASKGRSTAGTLPISPSEVKTVADVLQLVDSTVKSSVSVISALKQAHEVSTSGDIDAGIHSIKLALEGVAQLLHRSVVAPLANTAPQADPEVAARLNQIVAASEPPAHLENYSTGHSVTPVS